MHGFSTKKQVTFNVACGGRSSANAKPYATQQKDKSFSFSAVPTNSVLKSGKILFKEKQLATGLKTSTPALVKKKCICFASLETFPVGVLDASNKNVEGVDVGKGKERTMGTVSAKT